jgi:hypothetical protein
VEPIEVTARFNPQGEITPLSFVWRGHTYNVESTGRRWQGKDGVYVLVMVPGDQVYRLLFQPEEVRWKLIRGEGPTSKPSAVA